MSTSLDLPFTVSRFASAIASGPAYGDMVRTTWSEFASQIQVRRQGPKDGPSFSFAVFKQEPDGRVRRTNANLIARTAIALDIETSKETGAVPPSISEAASRLVAQGWTGAVYSSYNHTDALPRYRVVIPLSSEVATDLPVVEVVADLLGLGEVLDAGKVGAASVFYAPSCEPGKLSQHTTEVVDGEPIDAEWIKAKAAGILATREAERERERQAAVEAAAKRRAERIRLGFDPDASVIERIRGHLDLRGELEGHGYRAAGAGRFLYPKSETGVPGVYTLTGGDGVERVFSHHSGDPLAAGNLPSWCRAKALDAVDVVVILDHGGDLRGGLSSLAARFGIETRHQPRPANDMPDDINDPGYFDAADDPQPVRLEQVALPKIGKRNIPPRPWAYGKFLLTGYASALGALDGGGKGAMSVVIALAMITGRPLLGEKVWRTGPVAIISYEDDEDEWHRRIAAACDFYDIDYEFVLDNVRFIRHPSDRICFAAPAGDRTIYPHGDDIIQILREMEAVLLIVDPFNHAHGFDDGNNNVVIARVAKEMNRVAKEANAAALVLHHLRKGSTGKSDDMMGATSLRATFRVTRILARMTEDEAAALGVEKEAWRFSRFSDSKDNFAPPVDKATWFRLESISLGNETDDYPDGDNMQVTTTWQPTKLMDGIDVAEIGEIFARIKAGPGGDEFYSPARQSEHWVGDAIGAVTGKNEEHSARIVRQWLKNEVLLKDSYKHPTRRKNVDRVVINPAKAAAMTAQGWSAGSGE